MIFSVGCENKKSSALKNGQTALESHEYVKAQKYLSEALEQDSKNETARAMYMQAIKMPEAEYYKEKGLYNKGIESLESIVNLNNGSQKIKVESASLKNELEKSQSEFEEASNIRKENAKDISSQGQYKLEQDAIKENQKQEAIKEEEEQKTQEEENNQQNNQSGNTQDGTSQENTGDVIQTPSNQQSQPGQVHQPQQQPQV